MESPTETITNFQTFGAVTLTGGVYAVGEGANAGLFNSMAMPIGAQALRFRYRFATAGDGDFLSVGLDNAMSRESFIDAEAPVSEFSGQTNQLIFKLVSRGNTNAVLLLDRIEVTISDDPDGDGLTRRRNWRWAPIRFGSTRMTTA